MLAAGALAGLTGTIALPTASADADCTVSGLSNAIGTVVRKRVIVRRHPDANDAITNAGQSW